MEAPLTIEIIDEQTAAAGSRELTLRGDPPEQTLAFRTVAGSTGLRLLVRAFGEAQLLAEIAAPAGEPVRIRLLRQDDGLLRLEGFGRPITYLAPSDPPVSWFRPPDSGKFDVHFLIDATTMHPDPAAQDTEAGRLLQSESWTAFSERLAAVAAGLAADAAADVRTAVTFFGDWDDGLLHPNDPGLRSLRPYHAADLLAALRDVPRDSGTGIAGDFVDALESGLESCIRSGWREDARKLLIVFGDSPGYSVLDASSPTLQLADSRFRSLDVFEQAAELHTRGVEILTIFHEDAAKILEIAGVNQAELVRYARRQYERLASLPEWALSSDALDSGAVLAQWRVRPAILGKGPCPGLLI